MKSKPVPTSLYSYSIDMNTSSMIAASITAASATAVSTTVPSTMAISTTINSTTATSTISKEDMIENKVFRGFIIILLTWAALSVICLLACYISKR